MGNHNSKIVGEAGPVGRNGRAEPTGGWSRAREAAAGLHAYGQPAASALSELNTRPTLTVPCLRPVLVSGPPASSETNLPAWKL
jgi:hypothetical protein